MARIAIEVGVYLQGARGIPLFQRRLAHELAALASPHQYRLFCWFLKDFERKKAMVGAPDAPNVLLDAHRWPQSIVDPLIYDWDVPLFWPVLRAQGVRLYHGTSLYTPWVPGIKTVTTVCDMMPELFPHWGATVDRRVIRKWLTRADRLAAISTRTKRDVMDIYGIPEEKLEVILLGVDSSTFRPRAPGDPESGPRVRRAHALPERYLFTVGPMEPRRNLDTLLEVLKELRGTPEGRGLGLVVAGSGDAAPLMKAAAGLGLAESVKTLGYVPVEDLVAVHRESVAFVYPSLYEGFGLSPLEALACGEPVVSSNAASLPEVLGDAAALVDPRDVPGLAAAVLELMRNPELRRRRIEAGLKRAAQLTWRRTAEKYLALYERTLAA